MRDRKIFEIVAYLADHAVECAVQVMPETKYVYVASDTHETIDYLKQDSLYWADDNAKDSPPRSWVSFDANHTNLDEVGQDVHG